MAANEILCPECGKPRPDLKSVCPSCGAPPLKEGESRQREEEVRLEDLEPYVALHYIALLFKILAVIMLVATVIEIVLGVMTEGTSAFTTLIGEVTKLLIFAGVLWAGGDIMTLLIDAGHDLRVVRILLGRINAEMHRRAGTDFPPTEAKK